MANLDLLKLNITRKLSNLFFRKVYNFFLFGGKTNLELNFKKYLIYYFNNEEYFKKK